MSLQDIILIIVIVIWFLALVVSGILTFRYSKKHKPFIKIRNEYYDEWKHLKESINIKKLLTPLKIKMQLPPREKVYFLEDEIYAYLINGRTREYKNFAKTNDYKLDVFDSYYDEDDFITLKSTYKLMDYSKHWQILHGMMYITNERIMFESKGKYTQVPLPKVIKCYISIIGIGVDYYKGYIIHTEDAIYQIISTNPQVAIVINELRRYQIHKNEENKNVSSQQ